MISKRELERMIVAHKNVRVWLMSDWDPIGVAGYPGAHNEYYGYGRGIADLLMANASEAALAQHLADKENYMGLSPDPERVMGAAIRLRQRYAELPADDEPAE